MASPPTGRRRPARRRGGLLGTPKPARNGTDGRIRLLRLAFLVFLILVGGKAVALASSSQHLTAMAQEQQNAHLPLPAHRGSILDRDGVELAVGKPAQTVYADPHVLDDPKAAADQLCDALQIDRRRDRRAVEKALVSGKKQDQWFCYVEQKADPTLAKAALDLGIPGVGSYATEERTYPLKGTAAQVVGFAGPDETGADNRGVAGIESLYDEQLSGKPGSETIVRDPAGNTLKTISETPPSAGQDVRLTLDSQIQYTAEHVLQKALRDSGGDYAVSIVMDPRTGEVLTMATVLKQGFRGWDKDPGAQRNRCVTDQYEPGSTFKLVTASGALADGTVTPNTRFTLPPYLRVGEWKVQDAEGPGRGTVTWPVKKIIEESSNVGAVTIAKDRLGAHDLYKWIKAFGFGEPTGIDFAGEVPGLVKPLKEWWDSSIYNIPMGQGIDVTPIQMASMYAAIANNGVQVRPRLVLQVGARRLDKVVKHRVIPARVAREDRQMLLLAVEKGTGTMAQIPGYQVAGKTGTAQIADPVNGGYIKNRYASSFIGMVPAAHPKLVVFVMVHNTPQFGGAAAAVPEQQIMSFALQHLEIAP